MNAAVPLSQFQGLGGALIVSLIAFTIVFGVLAGLSAIICGVRYFAAIVEKKPKPAPATISAAPAAVQASEGKDMKKLVAAISAALIASTGRQMKIISVAPLMGNCSPLNQRWRAAGLADCLESRMGSRSW